MYDYYIYIQIEGFEAFNWGASATFGCRLSGLTIYRSIVVLALPLVLLERLPVLPLTIPLTDCFDDMI